MHRWLHLTGARRSERGNRVMGYCMAFNAGAINAGGFMALQLYTSHMTGFVSMMADHLVLGNTRWVLSALGALVAFTAGAAAAAVLHQLARRWHLLSVYALPLLLVAVLMLGFGLLGAATVRWQTWFSVPLAVLLLSFTMGVQNAILSKMSRSIIRTTHMTGVVTDLGIALGKLLLQSSGQTSAPLWAKVRLFGGLLLMFLVGGIAGAWGFGRWGFVCVVPLALLLMLLAVPPLWLDVRRLRRRWARLAHVNIVR